MHRTAVSDACLEVRIPIRYSLSEMCAYKGNKAHHAATGYLVSYNELALCADVEPHV
jgi:hypothetical protein